MKLIDKALGLIGLERKSRNPFAYVRFTRNVGVSKPDTVDIRLKNGQRSSGELSGPQRLSYLADRWVGSLPS